MGPSKFTRHWTEFSHSNIQCLCTETWLPRCELFDSIFFRPHIWKAIWIWYICCNPWKKQSSSSTQIVLEVCFTFGSERTCSCGYLWFLIRVVTIPHCYMLSLYPTSTGNIRRPSHKTAITPNDNGSCVLVFNNMKLWEHTIGVLLVFLKTQYST